MDKEFQMLIEEAKKIAKKRILNEENVQNMQQLQKC